MTEREQRAGEERAEGEETKKRTMTAGVREYGTRLSTLHCDKPRMSLL